VEDRVVQTALKVVIEPIFEKDFAPTIYGFRSGRGCKDALRRVDELLKRGYTWVVDADIKSYFDTISHRKLMQQIEEKVADGRVLRLLKSLLEQGVMRLRSILRKRTKLRGRGRGVDHQRWPNLLFENAGLYSLQTAYRLRC
jgi:retron-type reverse transcriptase